MNNLFKPGSEKIQEHIRLLTEKEWLSESQKKWPYFLFHFSELHNVIEILKGGNLLSREMRKHSGVTAIDIASPEVIAHTSQEWKNYVRLYFRPRTPTQYRNEGIRAQNEIELVAHCPIPVLLLFDAVKILELESTCVSNGNLAAKEVDVRDTVDFYLSLPFEAIYHDKSLYGLTDSEKNKIKFHRHAEVLIPKSLGLEHLKYIVCRSNAEFESLCNLLPGDIRQKWINKIRIDKKSSFFFRKWQFVQEASLSSEKIILKFNKPSISMFNARLEIIENKTGTHFNWEQKNFVSSEPLIFTLSKMTAPKHYAVSFYLDEHLAYYGIYREDTPFL